MHEWKVGELAVCVDASGKFGHQLRLGNIYVIERIFGPLDYTPYGLSGAKSIAFELLGVPNGSPERNAWGWGAHRFRPLDDSDYQRLTEKHKDSLPKRSLVKDDAEAQRLIERIRAGARAIVNRRGE